MKYHRCTPSGCNGIGIITFEFMAKTQFLTKLCLIFRYLQRTIYSLETMILLKRVFKKRIGWHLIGWWEQLFYFKNTLIFFLPPPPPLTNLGGGGKKKVYYTQPWKNYLTIFEENFYICGHSFSFLKLYFEGKVFWG